MQCELDHNLHHHLIQYDRLIFHVQGDEFLLTMTKGEDVMREEFERLLPTAAKGGFLISCDHQTPPGVSYSDYQIYISLFRECADGCARQADFSL